MNFDSVILAAVAAELNKFLANGRISEIRQPEPLDIVIVIRSSGANYSLLISANAEHPRIHLTSVRRPNPKTPPNFCMLLRKRLEGARFVGAEQTDFDRILRLKFTAYDGERLTMVVEIMGKHSNIVLINDSYRILGVIKPIGRQKNRYREVLPGRQYVPPPPQNKANPLSVTKDEFAKLLNDTFPSSIADQTEIASWLSKTFTGISPFAARELTARSHDNVNRLPDVFTEFFDQVKRADFSPVIITDNAGHTIGFYPFPSVQHPEANQHQRPTVSGVADIYYTSALPRIALERAKENFISLVQKEIESREHAIASIQENLAEFKAPERFKQIGDLILAQAATIPDGAESVELVDYYDPCGSVIRVELDPTLSAIENAEAYFKKYRKMLTGVEAMKDRFAEISAEIKLLRKVLDSANLITSIEQIQQLHETLETSGIHLSKQEQAPAEKRKPEFEGYKIGKVVSNGWEILYGQNSEANDYLLTRLASPNDYWVHVKAAPSAHVIIRTKGHPEAVPAAVLHAAAEIAAQHSDSKYSSLVPVDYTLRKYVRKPKNAPSGMAIYQREKTIFVTPNP